MRGKHNKLGEGERKVRLGQDSLPNIAISIAETSGNYIRCFTQTRILLNIKLNMQLPFFFFFLLRHLSFLRKFMLLV